MMAKVIFCTLPLTGFIQPDIVTWQFSAKHTGAAQYELHLTATVESPWHIYSPSSIADAAFPTRIHFNKSALVIISGPVKEQGKMINKYEEVYDGTVKYFEGTVDFIQTVKVKPEVKTIVSGTVEYMVCKEDKCLPPRKVPFTININ